MLATDTHRLDQHHVESGCLDDHHHLARGCRHSPEGAGTRRRSDEGILIHGQSRHARLVAEDAATGTRRRRIDGQHRHPMIARGEMSAEGIDECRLTHTRHARDADSMATPGMR
jgi:hypothetical protein